MYFDVMKGSRIETRTHDPFYVKVIGNGYHICNGQNKYCVSRYSLPCME